VPHVLWIEDLKSHATVGGNAIGAKIPSKTIVGSRNHEDRLVEVLVSKVLCSIEFDPCGTRTGMFLGGIEIEFRPRDILLSPSEASPRGIPFESSLKNQ